MMYNPDKEETLREELKQRIRARIEERIGGVTTTAKEKEEGKENEEALVLLVEDNCPSCYEMEQAYKEEIDKGNLFVLNINTELGKTLVENLGIKTVPEMLLVSKTKDDFLKICNDTECIEIEKKEKKKKDV